MSNIFSISYLRKKIVHNIRRACGYYHIKDILENKFSSNNDAFARAMTQCEPMELPLPPTGFFIKVKVDYPGIIVPNNEGYIYKEVEKRIVRDKDYFITYAEKIASYAWGGGMIEKISNDSINEIEPYWDNHMFENADPRIYYGVVANFRPKTIIEIGSGFSTKFCRRSIIDNNLQTKLIAIDPQPRSPILDVCDEHIKSALQSVDLKIFDQLEKDDILFSDGSHITFNGTDTVHLFLNILPRLKPGVLIHFHDIMLPYEYARGYVAHYYSEQYMVADLILNSDNYQIICPNWYLYKKYNDKFRGVSFWVKKIM
jgi:hypothetical protein